MLHKLYGDATNPQIAGYKYIIHVCNDLGAWGRGFVLSISKRWPEPEAQYRAWKKSFGHRPIPLGQFQLVEVEPDIAVVNLVAQHGIRNSRNPQPFDFKSFKSGIHKFIEPLDAATPLSLHMPAGIGSGLAGGNKEEIHEFLKFISSVFDVYLYEWDGG